MVAIGQSIGLHAEQGLRRGRGGFTYLRKNRFDFTTEKVDVLIAEAKKAESNSGVFSRPMQARIIRVKISPEFGVLGGRSSADARVSGIAPNGVLCELALAGTQWLDGGGALMNREFTRRI